MNTMVGGIKQDVQLDQNSTEILSYIRTIDPLVANAKLTRLDTQVVAGQNLFFHFDVDGKNVVVQAWSRPWLGSFL